jgi:hypothetical protein
MPTKQHCHLLLAHHYRHTHVVIPMQGHVCDALNSGALEREVHLCQMGSVNYLCTCPIPLFVRLVHTQCPQTFLIFFSNRISCTLLMAPAEQILLLPGACTLVGCLNETGRTFFLSTESISFSQAMLTRRSVQMASFSLEVGCQWAGNHHPLVALRH